MALLRSSPPRACGLIDSKGLWNGRRRRRQKWGLPWNRCGSGSALCADLGLAGMGASSPPK